jgi:hypothetical protein
MGKRQPPWAGLKPTLTATNHKVLVTYHLLKLVADGYLRRTATTRPILTDDQQQLLDATISEWKATCNRSSQIRWDTGDTRKTSLQDLAYDTVLEETRLGSQHAILATHQAAAALDGVEAIEDLDDHYKTSRPEFTSNTVKYDTRTMTLFDMGLCRFLVSIAGFGVS